MSYAKITDVTVFPLTHVRRQRGQAGGAAVEFALVLPLFVAILFGMIDYGWYFYQKFTLAAAIREGVRLGATYREDIVNGSDPYAQAVSDAKNRCDIGSVPGDSVAWSGGLTGTAPQRMLSVTGAYTFRPLVGIVRMPSSTMKYTMTMLLEQQY